MKEVVIYTDGACSGNPGPGGWAAVLCYGDRKKEICGSEQDTTNQRMEITAALKGLAALTEPCRVKIFSDSAYLVNAFRRGWLEKWQKNGWQTVEKKPVVNQDLWQALLEQCRRHQVTWHKVEGHADNELNNRCDELAKVSITKN